MREKKEMEKKKGKRIFSKSKPVCVSKPNQEGWMDHHKGFLIITPPQTLNTGSNSKLLPLSCL